MAIQAGMYPENLGLIQNYGGGGGGGVSGGIKSVPQDLMQLMEKGCGGGVSVGSFNQVLSQKHHQQQLYVQQQYMIQLQHQQQQHNLQQQQQQQQNNNNNNQTPGFVFSATSKNTTTKINDYNNHANFVSSLDAQLQKQTQEIDTYVHLQNERLKMLFQQQRKQQLSSLLRKLESRAKFLLTQKDEELSKSTKRTSELQHLMTKLEAENQVWRNLAFEKEATALSLHHELQKLKEEKNNQLLLSSYNNDDVAEDAESCCDDSSNTSTRRRRRIRDEEEESEGRKKMKMVCKGCNTGNLCVLFLPCRHLCSCKACEAFLDKCLICGAVKKGSIEALLS